MGGPRSPAPLRLAAPLLAHDRGGAQRNGRSPTRWKSAGSRARTRNRGTSMAITRGGSGLRSFPSAPPGSYERIQERAYFLWENRAGSVRWYPDSNWSEAERADAVEFRRAG